MDPIEVGETEGESTVQQAWAMAGRDEIENRTNDIIEEATDEIVPVLDDESLLTDDLIATLNEVGNGVELLIWTLTPSLHDRIETAVPDATAFVSGLEWLRGENAAEDDGDRPIAAGRSIDDPGEFDHARDQRGTGDLRRGIRERPRGDSAVTHGSGIAHRS